jgi:transcriptional regulator with XRE-family HTH domain
MFDLKSLKKWRKRSGLNQDAAARIVGLAGHSNISKIETGKSNMYAHQIGRLVNAMADRLSPGDLGKALCEIFKLKNRSFSCDCGVSAQFLEIKQKGGITELDLEKHLDRIVELSKKLNTQEIKGKDLEDEVVYLKRRIGELEKDLAPEEPERKIRDLKETRA